MVTFFAIAIDEWFIPHYTCEKLKRSLNRLEMAYLNKLSDLACGTTVNRGRMHLALARLEARGLPAGQVRNNTGVAPRDPICHWQRCLSEQGASALSVSSFASCGPACQPPPFSTLNTYLWWVLQFPNLVASMGISLFGPSSGRSAQLRSPNKDACVSPQWVNRREQFPGQSAQDTTNIANINFKKTCCKEKDFQAMKINWE